MSRLRKHWMRIVSVVGSVVLIAALGFGAYLGVRHPTPSQDAADRFMSAMATYNAEALVAEMEDAPPVDMVRLKMEMMRPYYGDFSYRRVAQDGEFVFYVVTLEDGSRIPYTVIVINDKVVGID